MNDNTAATWAASVRERLEAIERELRDRADLDPRGAKALAVTLDAAVNATLNVAPAAG